MRSSLINLLILLAVFVIVFFIGALAGVEPTFKEYLLFVVAVLLGFLIVEGTHRV